MEYKRLFLHHPSHIRHSSKSNEPGDDSSGGGGLLSVFVSLLADPLSRTGSSRTDADHLTIELVLHLFRNLLSAEPIMKGSAENSHRAAVLHQELIGLFERELVLDVLLVLSQEMEARENAQYNLLLMEILHHLFRGQDPIRVAESPKLRSGSTAPSARPLNRHRGGGGGVGGGAEMSQKEQQQQHRGMAGGSLRSHLQRERQQLVVGTSARHSHFGGTLVARRTDGKQSYISTGMLGAGADDALQSAGGAAASAMPARRKNRKAEPFVGAAGSLAFHTRSGASATTDAGTITHQAQRTLHRFCQSFVSRCYGPVMKSLKNEFRRDSVRLEEGDRVIFFRIVWFFLQWWRTYRLEGGGAVVETDDKSAVGQLIFTMDVFTFNLVFTSTDVFYDRKKHPDLMQTVALYQEMTQLLRAMYHSQDSTEHVMALGLMDRIFYGPDPIDRLPKLLGRWTPGTYTREYLCDLVELCHTTTCLLETNATHCLEEEEEEEDSIKKKGPKGKQNSDAIARMNAVAAEFDFPSYFARKIVSPQVVYMYTQLLSQYKTNVPRISDNIAAFFVRLSKVEVSKAGEDDADGEGAEGGEIKLKTSSLEPMLYNIHTIMVLGSILNDPILKNDPDSLSLLSFATVIIRHYARAAEENPMIHVESLLKHPSAHRFCEKVTNLYVTDELRMLVERDALLDGMREEEQQEAAGQDDYEEEPIDIRLSVNARRTAAIEAMQAPAPMSDDEDEIEFGADDNVDIVGAKERIEEKAKKIKVSNKTLTEEEKVKLEERRKKMAELAQKRKEHADAENAKEGGVETGEAEGSKDSAEENTGSSPKRKFGEDGEESAKGQNEEPASLQDDAPKTKRIKRAGIRDDSDSEDEDLFASAEPTAAAAATKKPVSSAANFFDDDSDDD